MRAGTTVVLLCLLCPPAALRSATSDSPTKLQMRGVRAETVHIKAVPGSNAKIGAKLCVTIAPKTFCYSAIANGKVFPLEPSWKPVHISGNPESARYLMFTALAEPFFSRQDKFLAFASRRRDE